MSEKPANRAPDKTADTAEKPPAAAGWPPLEALRREVDRTFEHFSRGDWRFPTPADFGFGGRDWPPAPACDMVEKADAYEITMEIPGVAADDLEVKVSAGQLEIRGEKKETRESDEGERHVSERRYGAFVRRFRLPDGVDQATIAAERTDGVLKLTLPKRPQAEAATRRIEVKAG